MRILSVSNCPLVETQGSGYVTLNFVKGLRERGHEVEVLGSETNELLPFLRGRARSYRVTLGMFLHVCRRLLSRSVDIVEFYGAESWLAVMFLSIIPQRKFLVVHHSNGIEMHATETLRRHIGSRSLDGSKEKWYQLDLSRLSKLAFTKIDGLVTVGTADRNFALKEKYQDADHVVAIDNSLPDAFLNINPRPRDKTVIGFCGTWSARKGCESIKNDMSRVLTEFPDCQLKLIGVGNNFRKEEIFSTALCSRIQVIPFVAEKADLKELYQTISILILPSIYESFGLVAAEAMACGCAVVASRTGFAASLKEGEEVLLMDEPGSPHLYECVKRLLLDDDALRQTIAAGGHKRVQALRWDTAIDTLEATYRRWLNELNRSTG